MTSNSRPIANIADLFWIFTFAVLMLLCPEKNYDGYILLPLFGVFQVAERHVPFFEARSGQVVSILVKLLLSYLITGYTHSLDSVYYPILLIPLVAAAIRFELLQTLLIIALVCAAYPSFLLFLDLNSVSAEAARILGIRVVFFIVIGYLVYEQASTKRRELQRALRAENALQRSERLAALGQLTTGLAHELRNPIATAKASAEMLMRPSAQSDPEIVSELSGYIICEIDRTASLISCFLDFAKPLTVQLEPNDVSSLIDGVFNNLCTLADKSCIELKKEIEHSPMVFTFDLELLRLAVLNLVKNAVEASTPGQTVIVRVEDRNAEVAIFISDNGSGIDLRNRENIFNPFFTTKANAVGLGLAVVNKIVDVHRGRIVVMSKSEMGTTFEVVLPRLSE
jgi:two-component system, NtrC family, sensor histidine kinase HydH